MSAPRKLNRVVIKEELVELTGGFIEALILNQFIYWSERVRDFDKFVDEEFKRATMYSHGQELPDNFGVPKNHGWVYKTAEELNEELMLGKSPQTIRKYLKKLIEQGLIEERNNPYYEWDNTKQYRVDLFEIQRRLLEMGYPLEGYRVEIPTSKIEAPPRKSSSDLENRATIPETTNTETTTEKKDVLRTTSGNSSGDSSPRKDGSEDNSLPDEEESFEFTDNGNEESDVKGGKKKPDPTKNFDRESKFSPKKKEGLDDIFRQAPGPSERVVNDGETADSGRSKSVNTVNDIIQLYGIHFKSLFDGKAPLTSGKDQKNLKRLINHYGIDVVEQMLAWMFDNWHQFVRECNIKSKAPNLGLFYGFRDYLYGQVLEDQNSDGEKKDENEF